MGLTPPSRERAPAMTRRDERVLLIVNPASGFVSKDLAVALISRKLRRHFAGFSLVRSA